MAGRKVSHSMYFNVVKTDGNYIRVTYGSEARMERHGSLASATASNKVVARSASVSNGTSILAAGVDNNTVSTGRA